VSKSTDRDPRDAFERLDELPVRPVSDEMASTSLPKSRKRD